MRSLLSFLCHASLLAILTTPALANDQFSFFDGSYSSWGKDDNQSGAASAFSAASLATGIIRSGAFATGQGNADANAYIGRQFTYTGSGGTYMVSAFYDQSMHLTGSGDGTASIDVELHLLNATTGEDVKTHRERSYSPLLGSYQEQKQHRLSTEVELVSGETYYVALLARVEASAGMAGTATSDMGLDGVGGQPDRLLDLDEFRFVRYDVTTTTTGGARDPDDICIQGSWLIEQDTYDNADALTFTSTNNEAPIHEWEIEIKGFSSSSSSSSSETSVDVSAAGASVPRASDVLVEVSQWVPWKNAMGLEDPLWQDADAAVGQALPNHDWSVGPAFAIAGAPGMYGHAFTITNADDTLTLDVSGLSFFATTDESISAAALDYTGPVYQALLAPGAEFTVVAQTSGSFFDDRLCFKYDIASQDGAKDLANAWGSHVVDEISAWDPLGSALAGIQGLPALMGQGSLAGGSECSIAVTNAVPFGVTFIVVGFSAINVPFKGGVLVPSPDQVMPPLPLDPTGSITLPFTWPVGLPAGIQLFFQAWTPDPSAVHGFSASNGLRGTTP